MTSTEAPPDKPPQRGLNRLELFSTVLMAVAALATAWSSYQATRWNGQQALAASRTNAIRIEAARSASLGEAQTEVDVATFVEWVDADRHGEDDLADFYLDRFRPEFRTAFDAWIATSPLTSSSAPPTPFAMPEYQVAARNEADRLDEAAEVSAAEVRRNIQRASNYVLAVVLYAMVLFFGGMSNKADNPRLRLLMVAFGYVLLLTTLGWIATFPINFAV